MSMHDLTLLNVAGSFQKAENVNEQRNLFPQTGHVTLNTFLGIIDPLTVAKLNWIC